MTRRVKCPAGSWTVLINNFASRMPGSWTIEFHGQEEVSGTVRESRGFLPFGIGMSSGERELTGRMTFERYWSNASYRLEVKPNSDLEAKFL